jgi:hypothetical protein
MALKDGLSPLPERTPASQSLAVSVEAACDWRGLGCSQQLPHKLVITYEEPRVALEILGKQIQFLIGIRAHITMFSLPAGKPSSQSTSVVGG